MDLDSETKIFFQIFSHLNIALGGPAVLGGSAGDQVRHDGTAHQLAGRAGGAQLGQLLVEHHKPGLLLGTTGGGGKRWTGHKHIRNANCLGPRLQLNNRYPPPLFRQ